MPDNTIKIDLSVQDQSGSIKARTNDAKGLNKELERSQQLTTGTRSGSRAYARTQPTKAEGEEYGVARGTIGTGAAGRDFAKQAQGLGGLVHVYATFAANLFAVSAAFRALSDAADTTNMVKGLEQLGAASGTNLTFLSKQLVAATDGAISLKEAMKAIAQASAAGMSSENIKKLGTVAKQVSVALGVDAPDALSRLSRGITKLEPELLDELGLFTKLDKSTSDYARSIGKPVSALTDFERRQAFANAVLTEANKKFGEIDTESNVYSKLLASLKNVSQTMLDFVNIALVPVIKLLSQNPTALMMGIIALTGLLLRQSIPAITQWRKQLHDAAEETDNNAKATKKLFDEYKQGNIDLAAKSLPNSIKQSGESAKQGMETARNTLKAGARLYNKEFNAMMRLDVSEITAQHTQVIEETRKKLTAAANKAAAGSDITKAQNAQNRLNTFNDVANIMERVIAQQNTYREALDKASPKIGFMSTIHDKFAKSAAEAHAKYTILANAVDNTQFVGPRQAFRGLILSIGLMDSSVGRLSKTWLAFRGTMTIIATTIGMVSSAFGNVLAGIGLVISAVSMLTLAASKNRDELERSSSSLDELKSNGENLYRVFQRLEKLNPLEQFTPRNTAAITAAIKAVVDSMETAIKDTDKTIAARGKVDIFTNWLAGLVGRSDEKLLSKQLNSRMSEILEISAKMPQSAAIRTSLSTMLGLDPNATDSEILDKFSKSGLTAVDVLQKIANKFNLGAQSSKSFTDSLQDTTNAFNDLANEFNLTDKLSVESLKSAKIFSELGKLLDKDVFSKLGSMMAFSSDTNAANLAFLPKDTQKQLIDANLELENIGKRLYINQKIVASTAIQEKDITDKLKAQQAVFAAYDKDERTRWSHPWKEARDEIARLQPIFDEVNKRGRSALKAVAEDTDAINSFTKLFAKASAEGFKQSSNLIAKTTTVALQKAKIATEQFALSKVSKTNEVIDKQTELANKQIDLDTSLVSINASLVLETRALRLEYEAARIQISKEAEAKEKGLEGNAWIQFIRTQTPRQVEIEKSLGFINKLTSKQIPTANLASPEAIAKNYGVSTGEATDLYQIIATTTKATAAALTQKGTNTLNALLEKTNLAFDKKQEAIKQDIENTQSKLDLLQRTAGTSPEQRQLPEYRQKEAAFQETLVELQQKSINLSVERQKAIDSEVSNYQTLGNTIDSSLVNEYRRRQQLADMAVSNMAIEKNTALVIEDINDRYAITEKRVTDINRASILRLDLDQNTLTKQKQEIENAKILGRLTEDEYTKKQAALSIDQANLDYNRDRVNLGFNLQKQLDDISKTRETALAGTAGGTEYGVLTPEQEAEFNRQKNEARVWYDEEEKRVARSRDIKIEAAKSTTLAMNRELAYTDLFKQAFKGMEDAIVSFVKTGKLNFKSLIDTFLEGLLRLQIQEMQVQMFKGLGGPGGMGSWLSELLKGLTGPKITATPTGNAEAKGGVYDHGIDLYAKGGLFTNSIVASPTLFKFAHGTGLMGEAGPEAIMPLKRDNQGNLGVRSTQPSTQVVVNNYGSEKATTRESVDSNGNRKIEVIIGELVAQEVNRTGSSTQLAMGTVFGRKPALARR